MENVTDFLIFVSVFDREGKHLKSEHTIRNSTDVIILLYSEQTKHVWIQLFEGISFVAVCLSDQEE